MKFELGYWVAQEEYDPNKLAVLAVMTEKANFAYVISSEHLLRGLMPKANPYSHRHGRQRDAAIVDYFHLMTDRNELI